LERTQSLQIQNKQIILSTNYEYNNYMSYNPAGGQTYTLQSSISSTQTTITLSSFTVPVSGDLITMSLMNTDIAYATIAPKTSSSEFISFTGITQNADGTATLTGVTRGLSKVYPLTEDTDYKLPHSGQSTFILSDAPQVFNKMAILSNDNVFTGQNEVPVPLDDADIANKGYVDALVNGGTVSNNRIVVAGVAGETISSGNPLYLSTSDGRWYKTDADDVTKTYGVTLGIAQGAGTTGNNITGGVLTEGTDTLNTGTAGNTAYIGNTAGALSTSAGTNTRAVGVYLPALAGLYFNPNIISGYPQSVSTVYAADSVGTDSYAITLSPAPGAYTTGMRVSFKAGTANTGACTLNVNSLGAKDIKKFSSYDTVTGDIVVGQVVTVVYDGTNFQMQTPTPAQTPVSTLYTTTGTNLGSSTTRFDITNVSGTTYRYTFDSTGTDPSFSAVNNPVGSLIYFNCQNFTAANNGLFVVTGSGTNYVEVTNTSGVAETDKTVGTGFVARTTAVAGTYTKSVNLKYAVVELIGAGGGATGSPTTGGGGGSGSASGAGGGSYSKKTIQSSSLATNEYLFVAPTSTGSSTTGQNGLSTRFGVVSATSIVVAGGGLSGSASGVESGAGGTATGGDLNIPGDSGGGGSTVTSSGGSTGFGGGTFYGGITKPPPTGTTVAGVAGSNYGSGGSGGYVNGNNQTAQTGGNGAQGVVIITEYFV
jgi:hypothetical protein